MFRLALNINTKKYYLFQALKLLLPLPTPVEPRIFSVLSLLSSNPVGAANLQQSPQMHPGVAATAGFPNPVMHALGSSPGFWLDGPQLDDHPRFQVFDRLGGHDSELQLPKSSYGHASHFERMH